MGKKRVDYQEYIQSAKWKAFAKKCKALAGWRCDKCGLFGSEHMLNAHHLTYARLGNERITDIQVLCKKCHAEAHGIKVELSYREKLRRLMGS